MLKRSLVLLAVVGIVLMSDYVESADWWDKKWPNRMGLAFNFNGDLNDFPVLVHLTSTHSAFWKHINKGITTADTKDLRFIDEDNLKELYFEAERIDYSSKDALIWVKVPKINKRSSINLYYGNSDAAQSSYHNAEKVWDNGFRMVQHLQETGAKPQVFDSTVNNNDSVFNSATPTTSGQVNGACEFKKENVYIDFGNKKTLDLTGAITIEAWVKVDSTSGVMGIIAKANGGRAKDAQYRVYNTDGKIVFSRGDGTTHNEAVSSAVLAANVWTHIAAVDDGTDMFIYCNGEEEKSLKKTITPHSVSDSVEIGRIHNSLYFKGTIDEVRISNKARNVDWIRACYDSQKKGSDFITINDQENIHSPIAFISINPPLPMAGKVDVTLTTSVDVAAAPTLHYKPEGKFPIRIKLKGSRSTWRGSFDITKSTGDGKAIFSYSAKDARGNEGFRIAQGRTFMIFTKDMEIIVAAQNSSHKERADLVCDGVDDQIEIQSAVDALPAAGGMVKLLAGRFNISMSIRPKKGCELCGEGRSTLLYLVNAANSLLASDASADQTDVILVDASKFRAGMAIHFISSKAQNTLWIKSIDGNTLLLDAKLNAEFTTDDKAMCWSLMPAIYINNADDVVIKNLAIYGNRSGQFDYKNYPKPCKWGPKWTAHPERNCGIYIHGSSKSTVVDNCHISNTLFHGILTFGDKYPRFTNNVFLDIGDKPIVTCGGYPQYGGGNPAKGYISGNYINGAGKNHFMSLMGYGYGDGIQLHPRSCDGWVITDNIIIDVLRQGIAIGNATETIVSNNYVKKCKSWGISSYWGQNNVIIGNTVLESGGISVRCGRSADDKFHSYVTIVGNSTIENWAGITLDGVKCAVIKGNIIRRNGSGIRIRSEKLRRGGISISSNIIVSDNIVVGNKKEQISIMSPSKDILIHGNIVAKDAKNKQCKYGLSIQKGCSDIVVKDNILLDTGAAGKMGQQSGLPKQEILSKLNKLTSSLRKDEGLIYLEQQEFLSYHKDPIRLYLNNKEVFIQEEGYSKLASRSFSFKEEYIQEANLKFPVSPYIFISFLRSKGQCTMYVKVKGREGGACGLYIILPKGVRVENIETEQWEETIWQDHLNIDRIEDRYLLYLRPEWRTGQDICIAELK